VTGEFELVKPLARA